MTENTMTPISVLYQFLGIPQKIEDQNLRIVYLHAFWGIEQKTIAKLEKISNTTVSRRFDEAAKNHNQGELLNLRNIQITENELKFLQALPREAINDFQLMAFIQYILKIRIMHLFFSLPSEQVGLKIAALHSLGIPVKNLMTVFNMKQAAISNAIKRNKEKAAEAKRIHRYDISSSGIFEYKIVSYAYSNNQTKIILAGGQ